MDQKTLSLYEQASYLLNEFWFPIHRIGYRQLCIAIPKYAEDDSQCITKTIYPDIAKALKCSDWRAVEASIRNVIICAWEYGNRAVWDKYFPGSTKPPSNKAFVATMAEYIKNLPPKREGLNTDCQTDQQAAALNFLLPTATIIE